MKIYEVETIKTIKPEKPMQSPAQKQAEKVRKEQERLQKAKDKVKDQQKKLIQTQHPQIKKDT